ncbi:MAG: YopX family protein [Candidatus Omnitrophica bacterium]|nr:YopX family protein [Candidatus Omnitrophota bacterium]
METKFRVWCEFEVKGEMVSCMESAASWFLLTQTGQLMEYGPMRPPHKLSGAYKKCIPLFFTGLFDKNGKEIYEGDVVKLEGMDRCFIVKYNYAGFEAVDKENRLGLGEWYADKRIEVIGNIYENPELLEGVSK